MVMDNTALSEALSAVMDGSAAPADQALVNAAWARDPALRERWALWHAVGDGLRSADLPRLHRDPDTLLAALHAQMPAPIAEKARRRDWLAPFAVAASFIAVAVGIGTLRPVASPAPLVAAAPFATPRAQGLSGMSFAQAAAGRTLLAVGTTREAGLPLEPPPEIIDWGLALPEQPAPQPRP